MTTLDETGRNSDVLVVTAAAQAKLAEILDYQVTGGNRVRVSVVRGPHGCVHGWNLGIEDRARPDDVVHDFGRVEVVFQPELTEALRGATIDYREDGEVIGFSIDAPDGRGQGGHSGCTH